MIVQNLASFDKLLLANSTGAFYIYMDLRVNYIIMFSQYDVH